MSVHAAYEPSATTVRDFVSWGVTLQDEPDAPLDLPPPQRGSFADYARLIQTGDGRTIDFSLFPFQAPTSESTAGPGLPGLYSDEVANARSVALQKSAQVGACLDPGTRVLTADLRWVRIDDVEVGMELVGIDEHPPDRSSGGEGGKGFPRKLRRAVVEAKRDVRDHAYKITLEDGRSVIATGDHRWLVRPRGHPNIPIVWRGVRGLKVGDRLRHVVTPWEGRDYEDGWMAGFLDGEGSMRTRTRSTGTTNRLMGAEINATQQLNAVYDRAVEYLSERGYTFKQYLSPRPDGRPPVGRIVLTRGSEIMRLVGQTRPSRFPLDWWVGSRIPNGSPWVKITAIEPLGRRRMVDLQTSEKTYVAEGFVSHNSEWAVRLAIRHADEYGQTAIVVMPTDDVVTAFARERIEPAIRKSSYLLSRIPRRSIANVHQRQIGDSGWLYTLGSIQSRPDSPTPKAQSIAASLVVFDEYELLDQRTISQMERRTSGQEQIGRAARFRRLGYPSTPGFGINRHFEASDRRRWHVHCQECDTEQTLSFDANVRWVTKASGDEVCRMGQDVFRDFEDVVRAWRACSHCEAELDVANGRWLADDPDADTIGYHVTRLMVPRTDLLQIVRASRDTSPEGLKVFYRNDLGEPYTDAEEGLDRATAEMLVSRGVPMRAQGVAPYPVTMGVDVASKRRMHYRISALLPEPVFQQVYRNGPPPAPDAITEETPQRRVTIRTGMVEDFTRLDPLIDQYDPWVVVVDSAPEYQSARALGTRFPGRVVVCNVTKDGAKAKPIDYRPETSEVTVHRSLLLDAVFDGMRRGRDVLPSDPPRAYIDHLVAMRREVVRDAKGSSFVRYVSQGHAASNDGVNDYIFADAYDLVAKDLLDQMDVTARLGTQGEEVVVGGMSGRYSLDDDGGYYSEPRDDDYYGGSNGGGLY